jgi:hypothetical protein
MYSADIPVIFDKYKIAASTALRMGGCEWRKRRLLIGSLER